jgi:hypothetical protein
MPRDSKDRTDYTDYTATLSGAIIASCSRHANPAVAGVRGSSSERWLIGRQDLERLGVGLSGLVPSASPAPAGLSFGDPRTAQTTRCIGMAGSGGS